MAVRPAKLPTRRLSPVTGCLYRDVPERLSRVRTHMPLVPTILEEKS
jgi:hypothetical protein